MTLSWPVVVAVMLGALLHAGWNALVKSSKDKDLDMAVIHLIGSFLAIPIVVIVGWPMAAAWPFIGASVIIHIGYYVALTGAYRHGELGLTYPLMRGVAPLLVALSATFTLGESLSVLAWVGFLIYFVAVFELRFDFDHHVVERWAASALAFSLGGLVVVLLMVVPAVVGLHALFEVQLKHRARRASVPSPPTARIHREG